MTRSASWGLDVLASLHLLVGVPTGLIFLLVFGPLSLLGFWWAILGVRLFRPTPRIHRVAVMTHKLSLGIEGLMAAYGAFVMIMNARSAAAGGGLLGGLGEMIVGIALVLAGFSSTSLFCLTRPRVEAAFVDRDRARIVPSP